VDAHWILNLLHFSALCFSSLESAPLTNVAGGVALRCAGEAVGRASKPSMNWLKSLSFSSQHSTPQSRTSTRQNKSWTSPGAQPPTQNSAPRTAPANATTREQPRSNKTMHVGGVHSASASPSTTPLLMQRDIDTTSPLSILAAASKLTTFPYGELQALNARMHLEATPKLAVNGVNASNNPGAEVNGVTLTQLSPVAGGSVSHTPLAEQRQKLRSKGCIVSIPPAKPLLPSPMPHPRPPPTATASNATTGEIQGAFDGIQVPDASISSITAASQRSLRKPRNVAAPALPAKARSKLISCERSTSLSSTTNTRSSKRLKTSHDAAGSELVAATTTLPFDPTSESRSVPPAANKRRVLPVRQGHIDILDGEISLLSTPQRLDSTPPPPYVC